MMTKMSQKKIKSFLKIYKIFDYQRKKSMTKMSF